MVSRCLSSWWIKLRKSHKARKYGILGTTQVWNLHYFFVFLGQFYIREHENFCFGVLLSKSISDLAKVKPFGKTSYDLGKGYSCSLFPYICLCSETVLLQEKIVLEWCVAPSQFLRYSFGRTSKYVLNAAVNLLWLS